MIAQQARVADATQHVHAGRNARQSRQAKATIGAATSDNPRVCMNVVYDTTQLDRGQNDICRLYAIHNHLLDETDGKEPQQRKTLLTLTFQTFKTYIERR